MAKDFLFELGCEELPAKGLQSLSELVGTAITQGLSKAEITFGEVHCFATPRRLGVLIQGVVDQQLTRHIERRGPDLSKAYDAQGQATPAALGFARSCSVDIKDLQTLETPEGQWLVYRATEPGKPTQDLLPDLIQHVFSNLSVPRTMRWGDGDDAFIRPVHWIVALFGKDILSLELFGLTAGNTTYGHRFKTEEQPKQIMLNKDLLLSNHHDPYRNPVHKPTYTKTQQQSEPQYMLSSPKYRGVTLPIKKIAEYEKILEKNGKVIANFEKRRNKIRENIIQLSQVWNANPIIPDDLLDEVTGLVEWPYALKVTFAERFLAIPKEALIIAMQHHQKCFAVIDERGKLLPWFITIANLESEAPEQVIKGNERVMRARLSDAEFFYQMDLKQKLTERVQELAKITFQKQLGTLLDKSQRIGTIATTIAKHLQINPDHASEAGRLAKADLLSNMVGEFPELQGIMGDYYARHEGKAPEVAQAIREHYLPRFAGDALPQTPLACSVALADRIDTLVGLFGIQQIPRGDKDPFGLRRSALGVVRILIEKHIDLDLNTLTQWSKTLYGALLEKNDVSNPLISFIQERFKSWCLEQGFLLDEFNAVIARQGTHLYDASLRLEAIKNFRRLPAAQALAAAHKRVNNILKNLPEGLKTAVNSALFVMDAERALAEAMQIQGEKIAPWQQQARYADILNALAELQAPVDQFFDTVMVMDENIAVRQNRLALLTQLHALLMQVADISLLQIS